MNLFEMVLNEKNRLERIVNAEKELIEQLPEGTLHVYNKKKGYNWFVTGIENSKKRTYLPKSEEGMVRDLALKDYMKAKLRENNENLKATNAYLRLCNKNNYAEKYLAKNDEIKRLVASKIILNDRIIQDWIQNIYTGPRPHPEYLTMDTKAGIKVRSKSEQIIVGHLFDRGIPFKYEDCLHMRTHDLFPDFTIMNPRTHEVYIWEHFGKMDDTIYRNNNMPKIEDYAKLGYYLGENFILTFETKASGIKESQIDFLIDQYLT